MVTFNDVLRIVTLLLEGSPAYDRQKLAETALHAWLDTVSPESREAVLDDWVQRMRFKMDYGG